MAQGVDGVYMCEYVEEGGKVQVIERMHRVSMCVEY